MKKLFCCVREPQEERYHGQSTKSKHSVPIGCRSLSEMRNALAKPSFQNVPDEIILHIFQFLSVPDLCNVTLVCQSFKMIADRDEIWKPKCNTSMKLHSKTYKQMYLEWMQAKAIPNQKLLHFHRFCTGRNTCIMIPPPLYPARPANKHHFQSIGGFNQHPNATKDSTIHLSVNIDTTARHLISLLEKASPFQEQWQQSTVLKQMIQRYYRFMQLKASQPSNILLIPTLDIEIVWQTHLLRPEMYRNDCLRLFRRIIDHSLIIENEMEKFFKKQAFLDTCQLYQERFGEEYCLSPFAVGKSNIQSDDFDNGINDDKTMYFYWDRTLVAFSVNAPKDYGNPFSFTEGDIILDLKWFDSYKEFMHKAIGKVSVRDRYSNSSNRIDLGSGALKRLKKSYERFLYMAAKYPLKDGNGFIPPTYAIDIIWHSHMQEPLNYAADCLRLVGYVIYHDPWPIIEDEKMKKSCDQVDQIWRDEFQCEIDIDRLYNTSDVKNAWFS